MLEFEAKYIWIIWKSYKFDKYYYNFIIMHYSSDIKTMNVHFSC